MLRLGLILAALLLAGMPATIGLMYTSFSGETPDQVPDQTHSPLVPERPDPKIDVRTRDGQDRNSARTGRQQAHNEGDDRTARASRPAP
jgi:hypothetical protein